MTALLTPPAITTEHTAPGGLTDEQHAALEGLPGYEDRRAPHVTPRRQDPHTLRLFPAGTVDVSTVACVASVTPDGTVTVWRERERLGGGWREVNRLIKTAGQTFRLADLLPGDVLAATWSRSPFEYDGEVEHVTENPDGTMTVATVEQPSHDPHSHAVAAQGYARHRTITGPAEQTIRVAERAGTGMLFSRVEIRPA